MLRTTCRPAVTATPCCRGGTRSDSIALQQQHAAAGAISSRHHVRPQVESCVLPTT